MEDMTLLIQAAKRLRRVLADLDAWEESLMDTLSEYQIQNNDRVSGQNNLHLAFLFTKLLVCRLQWRVSQERKPSVPAFRSNMSLTACKTYKHRKPCGYGLLPIRISKGGT